MIPLYRWGMLSSPCQFALCGVPPSVQSHEAWFAIRLRPSCRKCLWSRIPRVVYSVLSQLACFFCCRGLKTLGVLRNCGPNTSSNGFAATRCHDGSQKKVVFCDFTGPLCADVGKVIAPFQRSKIRGGRRGDM